jgi:TP53 regulating kinase and related kinases
LIRCLKAGVTVPSIRAVDLENGIIGMEWVDGFSVREVLGGGAEGEMEEELREGEVDEVAEEPEGPSPAELIMGQLGLSVGQCGIPRA